MRDQHHGPPRHQPSGHCRLTVTAVLSTLTDEEVYMIAAMHGVRAVTRWGQSPAAALERALDQCDNVSCGGLIGWLDGDQLRRVAPLVGVDPAMPETALRAVLAGYC